jgi:2-polyprenyl-3-methyl-5-hydroxy-6-metoxy-1,4-benzoquinol methylase
MKKAFLSVLVCLHFLTGELFLCSLAIRAQEKKEAAEKRETTIRNLTRETVSYSILGPNHEGSPTRRSLKPDGLDRWPCQGPLDIAFKRRDETVDYRLECGLPYTFRYTENDEVELYSGAHGLFGMADLAPFVPTPMVVVAKMLELAQVDKDDILFDLGCGDGRIVITAARKFGTRGVGIDIDRELIEESRRAATAAGVEDLVEFRLQDVMRADFSRATVVTLYLLPESNEVLRPLLDAQLQPGAYVVSHNYSIPGWEKKEVAYLTVENGAGEEHTIYVYRK